METGYTMETGRADVAKSIAAKHGLRAKIIVRGPGGYNTPLDEHVGSSYIHVKEGDSAITISVPVGVDETPFWDELNRLKPR
jgi:hypothetical protein